MCSVRVWSDIGAQAKLTETPMEGLQEQRRQVLRQLAEARRDAQRARRAYRDAVRRTRAITPADLTLGHRKQLLRMLHIARGDYDAAVACVDHASHPPPWRRCSPAEKRQLLQDVETHHTAAEVAAWADPWNAGNRHALLYLWNLWCESLVAEWVRERNQSRGVAPSTERVLEELRLHAATAPIALREHLARERSVSARKCWGFRWRNTWGGKMGTLPLGDVDDPAVLTDKVCLTRANRKSNMQEPGHG